MVLQINLKIASATGPRNGGADSNLSDDPVSGNPTNPNFAFEICWQGLRGQALVAIALRYRIKTQKSIIASKPHTAVINFKNAVRKTACPWLAGQNVVVQQIFHHLNPLGGKISGRIVVGHDAAQTERAGKKR